MNKSLYTDTYSYTTEASKIHREMIDVLRPLFLKYRDDGYSPREISHIINSIALELEVSNIAMKRDRFKQLIDNVEAKREKDDIEEVDLNDRISVLEARVENLIGVVSAHKHYIHRYGQDIYLTYENEIKKLIDFDDPNVLDKYRK